MLQELRVNNNYEPQLLTYKEKPLEQGLVRVKSLFGAPKHGTELTIYKKRPYEDIYYDEEEFIFKKNYTSQSVIGMGLGNMWIGKIIEISGSVEGFALGQRVAGYGHLASTHDVEPSELLIMPDHMSWQEAVCYDPMQFALSGLRDASCRIGDAVLISGLGAIGQMAAQAAKLTGASLVAVSDPLEIRRKIALDNGADIAFNPVSEDLGLLLRGMTDGNGVDVVIETSGNFTAVEQCTRALGYMGNMALVGCYSSCIVPIDLGGEAHFNQQNIFFSRACSNPNRDYPRWDFARICRESWKIMANGKIHCENVVSPIVEFTECDKEYDRYIAKNPEESIKMGVKF